MREFYREIDRKNRIFDRKMDILRKYVAERRIDSMSQAKNWAHKHHFILGKTKKAYLSNCENSHGKEQTGIFCELKTCFYLPLSG